MSGVLHPEGPEPAQTYWLRRVLVLLALLIVILVSVGVAGASMGATRQETPPAPAGVPSAATSASVSSGSPSASAPTSGSSSSSASSSASPSPSASSSSQARGSSASAPSCDRKDLKTSLTGKQMIKLGQPAAFTVRIANTGDAACRLILGRGDFELKITSGKQQLWSSKACNTATFVIAGKLELDQSLSWSMPWDGRATAAGCAVPGTALKRGTYLATATVTGGKSAELPVTLRA